MKPSLSVQHLVSTGLLPCAATLPVHAAPVGNLQSLAVDRRGLQDAGLPGFTQWKTRTPIFAFDDRY